MTSRPYLQVDGPFSWLVASAACFANVIYGGITQVSSLYLVIFLEAFGESRGYTALVTSLNYGVLAFSGPICSIVIRRYGFRIALFLGGMLTSIGLILSSFATGVLHLIITFGVIAGAGLGLTGAVTNTVAASYFSKWKGTAFGLSSAGVGLGAVVYPFLIELFVQEYAWRGSLLLLGGISLNICLCGAIMVPLPKPVDKVCPPTSHTGTKEHLSTWDIFKSLFTSSSFVILCFSYLLFSFASSVFLNHIAAYASIQLKLSNYQLSTLVSAIGISGLLFRLIIGASIDIPWVDQQVLCLITHSAMGIAICCTPSVNSFSGMVSLCCAFGATFAAYGPVLNSMALLYSGEDMFISGLGYVYISCGFGLVTGPPVAGWIFDAGQVYPPSLYLGGVIGILSGIIIIIPMFMTKTNKIERNIYLEVSQKHIDCIEENHVM